MMVRQHRIQGTVIITFYIRNLQLQRPGSGLFFQYPVIIFVAGYRKLYCFHLSLPYVAGYRSIYYMVLQKPNNEFSLHLRCIIKYVMYDLPVNPFCLPVIGYILPRQIKSGALKQFI